MLFGTTLTGITKYARRGEPPDSDTLTEWSDALYDSYKKDYRTRVSKDQVCSYYMKHLQKLCERKDLESCQTYHTFLLIHDVVPDPKRRKSALPDEEGWHPPMMKAPGDV